jgi:hydroxymethylpyrimidine pyrophosphatase-like HAD family hydrolase
MVLKDPAEAGFDYLMVIGEDEHPIDPVSQWWFEHMDVSVRTVHTLDEDLHPDHTVRLGVCALNHDLDPLLAAMQFVFADRAVMHHFPAVVAPDHAARWTNGEAAHILEVFAADATKWSAIQRIAAERAIPHDRIAAIGDQINDLSMIRGAGLGIAMGNAAPSVKSAAARHTRTNDQSGVAHAIRQILSAQW